MKSSVPRMVTNQAIFTIMHCAVDERMEVSIHDSSEVINGVSVVSESPIFFLPLSSL